MKVYIEILDTKLPVLNLIKGRSRFNESNIEGLIDRYLVRTQESSNVILIAHDVIHFQNNPKLINRIIELSKFRPILVSDCGDYPVNLKIPNVYSFRTGVPAFEKFENTIIVPYNVKTKSYLEDRTYNKIFNVSFAGYLPRVISRRLIPKNFNEFMHPILNNGSIIRRLGVRQISKLENSIVVIRKHYGGAHSLIGNIPKFEDEYNQTILESDFVFSPRGDSNQSARYFEVLSSGRIPIIPDTKILFPKLPKDSPKPVEVKVSATSWNLLDKLEEFWLKIDTNSYRDIQVINREIFNKHYSYKIFMDIFFKGDVEDISKYAINASD